MFLGRKWSCVLLRQLAVTTAAHLPQARRDDPWTPLLLTPRIMRKELHDRLAATETCRFRFQGSCRARRWPEKNSSTWPIARATWEQPGAFPLARSARASLSGLSRAPAPATGPLGREHGVQAKQPSLC